MRLHICIEVRLNFDTVLRFKVFCIEIAIPNFSITFFEVLMGCHVLCNSIVE